jgi:hypothetical protein
LGISKKTKQRQKRTDRKKETKNQSVAFSKTGIFSKIRYGLKGSIYSVVRTIGENNIFKLAEHHFRVDGNRIVGYDDYMLTGRMKPAV